MDHAKLELRVNQRAYGLLLGWIFDAPQSQQGIRGFVDIVAGALERPYHPPSLALAVTPIWVLAAWMT